MAQRSKNAAERNPQPRKTWPRALRRRYAQHDAAARKAKSRGRLDLYAWHIAQRDEVTEEALARYGRLQRSNGAECASEGQLESEAAAQEAFDADADAVDANEAWFDSCPHCHRFKSMHHAGDDPAPPEPDDLDHALREPEIQSEGPAAGDNASIRVFELDLLHQHGYGPKDTGLTTVTEDAVAHDHTIFRDPRPAQLRLELTRARSSLRKWERHCDVEARKSPFRIPSKVTLAAAYAAARRLSLTESAHSIRNAVTVSRDGSTFQYRSLHRVPPPRSLAASGRKFDHKVHGTYARDKSWSTFKTRQRPENKPNRDRGMRLEVYLKRRHDRRHRRLRAERLGREDGSRLWAALRHARVAEEVARITLGILRHVPRPGRRKLTSRLVRTPGELPRTRYPEPRPTYTTKSGQLKESIAYLNIPGDLAAPQPDYGPVWRLRESDQPALWAKRVESNRLAREARARFSTRLAAVLAGDKPNRKAIVDRRLKGMLRRGGWARVGLPRILCDQDAYGRVISRSVMIHGCVRAWLNRWAPAVTRKDSEGHPAWLREGKPIRFPPTPREIKSSEIPPLIGRHPDCTLPELAAEVLFERDWWLTRVPSFTPTNPSIVQHSARLAPPPQVIENPASVLPIGRPVRSELMRPIPGGIRGCPSKAIPREHPKPPKCRRPNSVAAITTFKRPNWQDNVQSVAARERIAGQALRPRRELPTAPAPKAYVAELAWRERTWRKLTGSRPLR